MANSRKNDSPAEQSFSAWAFSTVDRLRKAVGLGAVLAAAVSIKNLEPQTWAGKSLSELADLLRRHTQDRMNLAYIQAAACFALALVTPRPSTVILVRRKGISTSGLTAAKKACRRIQLCVVGAFISWALYYVTTAMAMPHSGTLLDRAVGVTLNTLPSVLLFWLYIELAELTVPPEDGEGTATSELTLARRGDAAFHYVVSIGVFALVVGPVWYACARNAEDAVALLEVASSCLNGVALALVVGRLGSKYIDPGSITLGLLYFYAVIQTAAASFQNPAVHLFATSVALPLKVLLWLVCVWAFTSGILSEYVYEIRVLLTHEDVVRARAE